MPISELQSVMMNLGMNAVDAMPRGGRVTFETRYPDDLQHALDILEAES